MNKIILCLMFLLGYTFSASSQNTEKSNKQDSTNNMYLTHINFDKIVSYIQQTGETSGSSVASVSVNNEILDFNIQVRSTSKKQLLFIQPRNQKDLHFRVSKYYEKLKWGYECLIAQVKENKKGEQIFEVIQVPDMIFGKSAYHVLNFWFKKILSEIEKKEKLTTQIDIEIPKFEDADVQKLVNEYITFMNEYIAVLKEKNTTKITELGKQAQEWRIKMQPAMQKLLSKPEEMKKFIDFTTEIFQQMIKKI